MESYVERWEREQKEKKAAAEKKAQKKVPKIKKNSVYGEMQKEVAQDGKDTRGEGHEAQEAAGR